MAQCVRLIQNPKAGLNAVKGADDVTIDYVLGAYSSSVAVEVDVCPGLILVTPVEYRSMSASPFNLSVEDGALLSGAIGGVWCLAWALRAIRSALDTDGETNP